MGLELGHVANVVGGFDSEPKVGLAPGVRFTPLSKARQQEAVQFFNENLFKTPAWLAPTEILRKIEPTSGQARLLSLQQRILNSILGQARLSRLQEHEAILGDKAYTAIQLLADLRSGIFTELASDAVKVDPFRRNLQRAYVDLLVARIAPAPASAGAVMGAASGAAGVRSDDSRGVIRAELKTLLGTFGTMAGQAADKATRIHLDDLKDQVSQALDPKGLAGR
jgi:hypothetical protein